MRRDGATAEAWSIGMVECGKPLVESALRVGVVSDPPSGGHG